MKPGALCYIIYIDVFYVYFLKGVVDVDISVGDILNMKKPHPCGENRFQVLRIGMDFKIKCMGCGHEVMAPRSKIEKRIKTVVKKEP